MVIVFLDANSIIHMNFVPRAKTSNATDIKVVLTRIMVVFKEKLIVLSSQYQFRF
jgi:hypothetical protein